MERERCFSMYTNVFFIFLLILFKNIGEHARKKFFSHSYPLALVVNKSPGDFIFYHARSTNFEKKIEGL